MTQQEPPEYAVEQKDLRRNLRSPLIVEKIPCGDGYKTFFGYAKNISRGGLFVATLKPREPGELFTVELTLPGTTPLKLRCQCTVVWKRHFVRKSPQEPGMGLKFVDLADEVAEQVEQWVRAQPEPPAK